MSELYSYPSNDYRSYLAHHGVKGMKWGVRREQARKARIMRAYGITSKQYDSVRQKSLARHKKGNIVKGALIGANAARMAIQAPKKAYEYKRDNFIALNDRSFDVGVGIGTIGGIALDAAVLQGVWTIGRNALDTSMEAKEFEKMRRK